MIWFYICTCFSILCSLSVHLQYFHNLHSLCAASLNTLYQILQNSSFNIDFSAIHSLPQGNANISVVSLITIFLVLALFLHLFHQSPLAFNSQILILPKGNPTHHSHYTFFPNVIYSLSNLSSCKKAESKCYSLIKRPSHILIASWPVSYREARKNYQWILSKRLISQRLIWNQKTQVCSFISVYTQPIYVEKQSLKKPLFDPKVISNR